jgi:SAM-dependent methyltransferase
MMPKKTIKPEQQRIINSWGKRADAYHDLTQSWPIFTTLAKRLIAQLPLNNNSNSSIIDLASGSGLVSSLLLQQFPKLSIHGCDPAGPMLEAMRDRFQGSVRSYHQIAAHELGDLGLKASAILCNCAFHLMDEETVLPEISKSLGLGGLFVANLWGHSFDETAESGDRGDWHPAIEQALQDFGQDTPQWPEGSLPQRIRTRSQMAQSAANAGLILERCEISKDFVPANFAIAFLAMSDAWPGSYPPGLRQKIVARGMELLSGEESCYSVLLCFRKGSPS